MQTVIIDFAPEIEDRTNRRREAARRRSQIRRRKQRNLLLVAIVTLVALISMTWHFARASMVELTITDDVSYIVEQGDTLWGLCMEHRPEDMDIREFIHLTVQYNEKDNAGIDVGEVIRVPIYEYTLKK